MSRQHSTVRAYGVLIHEDRVVLVRSSNPRHVPPLWWLPGGGIAFGEVPEDTLSLKRAGRLLVPLRVLVAGRPRRSVRLSRRGEGVCLVHRFTSL